MSFVLAHTFLNLGMVNIVLESIFQRDQTSVSTIFALSGSAKHSRLKGLLNPISVAGGLENPLVGVEYKGRQSNVILTTQGEMNVENIWRIKR